MRWEITQIQGLLRADYLPLHNMELLGTVATMLSMHKSIYEHRSENTIGPKTSSYTRTPRLGRTRALPGLTTRNPTILCPTHRHTNNIHLTLTDIPVYRYTVLLFLTTFSSVSRLDLGLSACKSSRQKSSCQWWLTRNKRMQFK